MSSSNTLILKQTFAGLDNKTLATLRQVAQRQTYPQGSILCRQGEIEHKFYILVEGRVSVVQRIDEGEERLLSILGPNTLFGEMSLIDDSPRMATVMTLMPTTVLEITEEIFDHLMLTSPVVAYAIIRRVLDSARRSDRQSIDELKQKNIALEQAYEALVSAQNELVEKKRLERELELAAAVQRDLLPGELPQFSDYNFAAYLKPARQVGGDFYDVFRLDDEHVGLLIADVADKGLHAALIMAVTRTLFLQEGKYSLSPAKVAEAVHHGMLAVAATADMFVTAFYGVLHRPSGSLIYIRAGHDRPLLYRPGAGVESLAGNGRFLGMWPELTLEEYQIQLKPGDRLLLFSDGVPDAINRDGEHFSNRRLKKLLAVGGEKSASDLIAHIADGVAGFCQEAAPFDDLTLLAVESIEDQRESEAFSDGSL